MPYLIKQVGSKYELRLKSNNKLIGTHPTKTSAQKQIAAIEINKLKKKK
jgi:hypothetical protein